MFLGSDEDVVGGTGGRGPGAGGPPARVAGPGRRIGPVEVVSGAGARTCSVVTAGPRPCQVQRHAYPGHLNLRMCSPGSVLEPWKGHWQAGARRR